MKHSRLVFTPSVPGKCCYQCYKKDTIINVVKADCVDPGVLMFSLLISINTLIGFAVFLATDMRDNIYPSSMFFVISMCIL